MYFFATTHKIAKLCFLYLSSIIKMFQNNLLDLLSNAPQFIDPHRQYYSKY